MASKKFAYKNKGNQIAIVEKSPTTSTGRMAVAHCTVGSHANKADCEAAGGQWIPGTNSSIESYGKYTSPVEDVEDGLEIEYTYIPSYRIQTTNDVDTNINQYMSTDGKLTIADNTSAYINYATTYGLAANKYIVLEKAGRFNGLHKIESIGNNTGTNNKIILTTKYTGSESSWTNFEESPINLYYAIDVMEDESFDLELSHQQCLAIVYYIKAKMMEDMGEVERREYFLREFKRTVEKAATDKRHGVYRSVGFGMTR